MITWDSKLPITCDACKRDLGHWFIDGITVDGIGAILCCACHQEIGTGIGIGKGQVYSRITRQLVDGLQD